MKLIFSYLIYLINILNEGATTSKNYIYSVHADLCWFFYEFTKLKQKVHKQKYYLNIHILIPHK